MIAFIEVRHDWDRKQIIAISEIRSVAQRDNGYALIVLKDGTRIEPKDTYDAVIRTIKAAVEADA